MFRSLIPWTERPRLVPRERFFPVIDRMDDEMAELMEQMLPLREGWLTPTTRFVPRANLVETDKQFEVTVELPGMDPKDVAVELRNGDLWISGTSKEEKEEKGKTFHRIERRSGEFRRVLPLPSAVDENKIEAHFDKGVLKVNIPKTKEATPKHIDVKT